ncbi:hypothetical protein BS50DRAFT_367370 [Corynespora cassiicola Philippines]|uniref:Uncharacterized protein n=1 Tax=Corynespora cassiicola Philippines TaxID=1448308 RepID=A0A2T2NSW7_CORCC|nr:hypothetical protein BS50DRAFT_367370 [Corynespora cassiicola Philippines]
MHRYSQANQKLILSQLHQALHAARSIRHGLDVGVRHSLELGEVELAFRSDLDESALVARAVAVVWCGEDGDAAPVMLNLVALHAHFVRSNNCLQVVLLAEPLGNVRAKLETHTTLAGSASGGGLGVGPEHLHHKTRLARLSLLEAVQFPHIVKANVVVGEETAVQHKEFLVDEGCEGQRGEGLGEELEDTFSVLGPALALEAVHPVHVVCLVVSTVEEEAVRVQPLVGVEEKGDFGRPRASIDKVTIEEEGVLLGGLAGEAEDFHEVEELACV